MSALATHSGQLERWLGAAAVEDLSRSMRQWYGPPIAVAGVPGEVYVCAGGDYRGRITEGRFASALDLGERFTRRLGRAIARTARRQAARANMPGFASLSDLISEMTVNGKGQEITFSKTGTTGVISGSNSLWGVGPHPAAGAAGAAAPGGTAHTRANTGALPLLNAAVGGDTTHLVNALPMASVAGTLMLYDRLFSVAKTMNSTSAETISGVPTRYTSTTPGAIDSAAGNFLFFETQTVLAAVAHNWSGVYTDQDGTTAISLPSLTGNSANIVNRLDHPLSSWFAPLATGDRGLTAVTSVTCSALVTSGAINVVIGHPIATIPVQIANMACLFDGINTAFNLRRVFDNACLALLELAKPATTAATYSGTISLCAG